MPIPSSSTVTSIQASVTWARTTTVPPSGEYLKAFSKSCPTMMSVAMVSPLAAGRSSGMSATTTCLSDSGRDAGALGGGGLRGAVGRPEHLVLDWPAEGPGLARDALHGGMSF